MPKAPRVPRNPDSKTIVGNLTLRDYFAGQALTGYVAAFAHPQATNPPGPEETAQRAYAYADEMLAQREKEAQ